MGKHHDDNERLLLTRRGFIGYSGASLALLGVASCAPRGEAATGTTEDAIDVSGLSVAQWIDVWRPDDLLLCRVGLVNMVRSADLATLSRAVIRNRFFWRWASPALIVVAFPPQHLNEQALPDGSSPPGTAVLSNLADESRLVFYVPDGTNTLPFDPVGFLTTLAKLGMNVEANAAPDAAATLPPNVAGTTSGTLGRPVAPLPLETSIELPWRVQISPNVYGRWDHAVAPVVSQNQRVELWHTQLATVGATGDGVDRRPNPLRTTRAIWTRGGADPFVASLAQGDRDALVEAMADERPDGPTTYTMPIDRLALSALGGWLDTSVTMWSGPIAHWIHRAAMGRDVYVEVAYRGMAFPFRHRVLLLKITERKLHAPDGDTAALYQRYVLVPTERTHTYDEAMPANVTRQRPLQAMTILDRAIVIDSPVAIPIAQAPPQTTPAAFAPTHNGAPVTLLVDAVDGSGATLRLRVPFVWAPTDDAGNPTTGVGTLQVLYAPIAKVDAAGQRIQLAPPRPPDGAGGPVDNTTFQAHSLTFGGVAAPDSLLDFHPVLAQAEVAVDALRHLTGDQSIAAFKYADAYVNGGFGLGQGANPRDLFLQLADQNAAPLVASFAAQAGQIGGFVTPNLDVRGLSRALGPISEIDPTALASAITDPTTIFPAIGSLPVLSAKLFGCLSLSDVLGRGFSFDQLVPTLVTDALHEVDRYRAMFQQIQDVATKATTSLTGFNAGSLPPEVGQFVTDVQTRIATLVPLATRVVTAIVNAPTNLGNLTDPTAFATALGNLTTPINDFLAATGDLPATWLSSKALPYVARTVAGFEVQLRQAASLLQRIAQAASAVEAQLGNFLRGLELVTSGQLTIDWSPPLQPWPSTAPIFQPHVKGPNQWDGLTLAATIRARANGDDAPGVDLLCSLEKFSLVLGGSHKWVTLAFDKLQFRQRSGKKPEVDCVFGGITFGGPLSFVQTLRDVIPLDGFSDPPGVDITPTGITASYSMGLPDVAIGMFSLENLAISSSLELPFLGDSMAFRFAFSSREHPFTLTVSGLGGTGFFALEVTPQGLTALEAQLEFGARVAIDLGVASGSISVMGGVYFGWSGGSVTLTGFLRMRGEVSVLDLITASIELYLALEYRTDASGEHGKLVGRAHLQIEVSIPFFSTSVSVEVERKLAGAAGDPSYQDTTQLSHFNAYRAAFAA